MLHLSCRIALRWYIGDLLDLQGALKRIRIVILPTEIEIVRLFRVLLRQFLDRRHLLQYMLHMPR